LPQCDYETAEFEITACKEELESSFGLDINTFAYPNGDYTDREVELVQAAGYQAALTVDPGYNDARTDLFRLKRLDVNDTGDYDELAVKASGFWAILKAIVSPNKVNYQTTVTTKKGNKHESRPVGST
jgi:peptidoglycan/xylan/chitin deacetylase (PgdA/CDA1 family)